MKNPPDVEDKESKTTNDVICANRLGSLLLHL